MAKLIYVTMVSLDGYIEDERGAFDWFPIDDEVFAFTTDLLRSVGTFLYGRRLYEAMAVWETDAALAEQSDLRADFASAWQAAAVHPAHCRRRGKPGLPTGMRADLELLDERRFRSGVVHLRYRIPTCGSTATSLDRIAHRSPAGPARRVAAAAGPEARSNVERRLRNRSCQRLVKRVGNGLEFS